MEPILSTIASNGYRNEPRDLQSRLYREIGISAVAAALEIADAPLKAEPTAREKRERLLPREAA